MRFRFHGTPLLSLFFLVGLEGCTDHTPVEVPARASHAQGATADRLARALAITLADPEDRGRVLATMRGSRLQKNGIELKSFFYGPSGSSVASTVAERAGMTRDEFAAFLAGLPDVVAYLPRSYDRLSWSDKEKIVVASSLQGPAEFASATLRTGYDGRGLPVAYDPRRFQPFPILLIRPVPDMPEQAAAPSRSLSPPPSSADVSSQGYTLTESISWSNCTAPGVADDGDGDGVSDSCEHQVAFAFRPRTLLRWDDEAPTREPYWTVRPDGQGALWVMYLLAYHSDPGDVSFGTFSHKGDSEFILLRIVNSTLSGSHWYADRAILSAHWGTDADDSYSGDAGAMEYTDDVFRGRPLVHVAKDKHANYRSRSECNWGGGLWTDTCDGIQVHIHVPVLLARNIGNYTSAGGTKKLDCVPSERIAEPAFGREECFFTGTFFGGWLNSATYETSAGAYAASLRAYGFKPQTFTVIDNECREYARYC